MGCADERRACRCVKGTTDEGAEEALYSTRGCMAWMCDRRWSDDLAIDRIGEGDSVRGS